ncbi:MAG: zinc-binding dehydrogenase [Pseudomonadota bacterium]
MAKTKMKAVVAAGKGGTEVLEVAEVPLDWPRGPHDVLVRLKAAGLNPFDVHLRRSGPLIKDDQPIILGSDGAGIVEAVGDKVRGILQGEEVAFCYGGIGGDPGTYAEFAVVPAHSLARKPENVSFAEAAAAPLVTITCWEALYQRAQLASDEHCLIHGGAGGTGHVAIQLAKLRGARVAATVGDDDKAAFVKDLGADHTFNYRREDVAAAALVWTDGRGIDVALDNVGGDVMHATFHAMAPFGRVVGLTGLTSDNDSSDAFNRNITVHNVMMLMAMWIGDTAHAAQQGGIVNQAMGLMADGKLRLHVAETFPLVEAAAAQQRLEQGGMTGKMVLLMD